MFKKSLSKYILLLALLITNTIWWSYIDRPHTIAPTEPKLDCVSYNPYRQESTLNENKKQVSKKTLEEDFAIISKRFQCVRTYTSLYGMDAVPEIAEKYGLTVLLGVWISEDLFENMTDLQLAIALSRKHSSVTHLIIGNEALFFSSITPKYIYLYLRHANKLTNTPVSTGEIISTWIHEKKLSELSDFIAIHIFPFWNNIPLVNSLDYLAGEYDSMTRYFPGKEIFITETGWPSNGVDRGQAESNLLTQATYFRMITKYLGSRNIRYNIIEAFDQPWKIFGSEKHAGGSFGVFDDAGREKFALTGQLSLYGSSFMVRNIADFIGKSFRTLPEPIQNKTRTLYKQLYTIIFSHFEGALLAISAEDFVYKTTQFLGIDSDIGLATSILFLLIGIFYGGANLHLRVGAFLGGALVILILINIIVMIGYKAWIGHYLALPQFWINVPLMLLPVMGILYQLRDYLKIIGKGNIKYHMTRDNLSPIEKNREPFVSIHIPSYNEEPEMLIKTIEHVLQLQYKNYELIIVENNTKDENIWKPVQGFVEKLGKENIRFYHFDALEGYKSGALNKALELTHPDAKTIALLDADYCVSPEWLQLTVGLFCDPAIAAIQCPQANDTTHASTFQKIMSYELDLFYKQGMVIRNQSNATIMNGTMCLIRRDILEKEKWCNGFICEDSELGLRIQASGKKILYIDHILGKGLPPRNFEEYKKQRFRWSYGAMMIFKTHWKKIFFRSKLTLMQRFEYLFGWIGWGQMILYPFYLVILLFGSYFIYDSYNFEAPYDFALLTLFYVFFLIISTITIYRDRMNITLRDAFLAVLASASLTITIFRAVFLAIFWNDFGFKKTNKGGKHQKKNTNMSWLYNHPGFILLALINVTLVILSASILFRYGINTDTLIWFLLVVTITLPTLSALYFQIMYE